MLSPVIYWMTYQIIDEIEKRMRDSLNDNQMDNLHKTLLECIVGSMIDSISIVEGDVLPSFISAKRIEGCSERTLEYYQSILENALNFISKPIRSISTNDIRDYLSDYQKTHDVSKTSVDNVRRILSSFFSWLEDEDLIFKSPVRRIRKVRTEKIVKEVYSDETLEILRDGCNNIRDLAMLDLLISTGIRVGELVNLNISDIDFDNRECVVFGKGMKERLVYFDARTKVHLLNYLKSRNDSEKALFVSLFKPHRRLEISGVETRLKHMGKKMELGRVHPHKFRRTLATRAIDKGMPIEQVQKLLGHTKIDTTMEYAIVDQNNVKNSHRKYIS